MNVSMLALLFLQLYKCAVGCIVLTDSKPRPTKKQTKKTTMQFYLIQADQPLSNSPICVIPLSVPDLHHAFFLPFLVISDVFNTLVLVLLPVILCSQTGLRHAVCGPPGTPEGEWSGSSFPSVTIFSLTSTTQEEEKRPGLATTETSKKNSAEGFLWDKDCQCQLQYDKCQCYEDRHEQGWVGWPFANVTCHQSFMSPSKQYVRGIKNHYTLELCYTGQK